MSKHHLETFTCPKCEKESSFVMYDSVNVTLDPEYKAKILDGSLFAFKCPECGTVTNIDYNVLYHDMDKQIMIQVCSSSEDAVNAQSPANILGNLFSNLSSGLEKINFRTVVGVQRLVEKVRIFDADLDDYTVEMIKSLLIRNVEGEKRVFFSSISDGDLQFAICFEDGEIKGFTFPHEKYLAFKEISENDPNKNQLQFVDASYFLSMVDDEE